MIAGPEGGPSGSGRDRRIRAPQDFRAQRRGRRHAARSGSPARSPERPSVIATSMVLTPDRDMCLYDWVLNRQQSISPKFFEINFNGPRNQVK